MAIALQSDFRDFYDHWFAVAGTAGGHVYRRMMRGGLARPAMFSELERAGFKVPSHGSLKHLAHALTAETGVAGVMSPMDALSSGALSRPEPYVVVYDDEQAHAGFGKVMMSLQSALRTRSETTFASEFCRTTPGAGSWSLRRLRIGTRQFLLRYSSRHDWRSNCGQVTVDVLGEEKRIDPLALRDNEVWRHPLTAIDLVQGGPDYGMQMLAVDLNIAPRLAGSGVEDLITGREVYDEIDRWIEADQEVTC